MSSKLAIEPSLRLRSLHLSRREWTLVAVGVIGFSIVGYGIFSAESNEERIRALLTNLALSVRVDPDAPNVVLRAAKINRQFAELFAKDVAFADPEYASGQHGREQLAMLATGLGSQFSELEVKFTEIDVEVEANGNGARAVTQATATGLRQGIRFQEGRQVDFELSRHDGNWWIDRFTVVPDKSELRENE